MNQKEKIMDLLTKKGEMTQSALAEEIYGDKGHTSNIYSALTRLVSIGAVLRSENCPSYYSLSGAGVEIAQKSNKTSQNISYSEITNKSIEEVENKVRQTDNYGRENELISRCLKRFPANTDPDLVAMKMGLIDITNSTHLSQYKSKISVVEFADIISKIDNIDKRIKEGDPSVVNAIAKSNGKINLFSFASKYCCYHNRNLYERDDYSIFDTVLKEHLPEYFNDVTKDKIQKWQSEFKYEEYNDYITEKLNELGITIKDKKRKFDHFVWYNNRGKKQ